MHTLASELLQHSMRIMYKKSFKVLLQYAGITKKQILQS